MDKGFFRKKYKVLRDQLSSADVHEQSIAIANQALRLPIWDATYFHLFLSITSKKEVNTEYILHILQGKDKSVVVSKADFNEMTMQHFLLQENTPLKVSAYGIPEPQSGIAIEPKLLDVIFVPLLAFDKNGYRIGYGKGFYDRFLAECRADSVKIGLSFFDAEDEIVHENLDFPLDFCITPKKIYSFKESNLYL